MRGHGEYSWRDTGDVGNTVGDTGLWRHGRPQGMWGTGDMTGRRTGLWDTGAMGRHVGHWGHGVMEVTGDMKDMGQHD